MEIPATLLLFVTLKNLLVHLLDTVDCRVVIIIAGVPGEKP